MGFSLGQRPCLLVFAVIVLEMRNWELKFIYSEKDTKFCKISTLILSYVVPVKSKVEISQNFVAFSEYMNFKMGSGEKKSFKLRICVKSSGIECIYFLSSFSS